MKAGIDQDSLIDMFATASAKQSAALRKAVHDSTLGALQGRELTLKNIRGVLQAVGQAASAGAAQSKLPALDVQALLDNAVAGMDDALLKAVDANRVALERLQAQGADFGDKQLKKAMADLEKFEDMLFDSVQKVAKGGADTLAGPWDAVLDKLQLKGSASGAQAAGAVTEMTTRMQQAVRESRAAGLKAATTLAQSYAALVSGVLIGMSDAFKAATPPKKK